MGWRTIVVNQHSKLTYKNNHLLYKDSSRTEMIHLSEIDILLLETTDIVLSTMLVKRLSDENILVIFCDNKRLPVAQLVPYYGKHDSSLQFSKQIEWNETVKGLVWTEIIAQKIFNQAVFLYECGFDKKSESLTRLYDELQMFDPSNREGHAARIYFNTLFGNGFNREQSNDIMEPFRPIVDRIVYENRESDFNKIKSKLFQIFIYNYGYSGKEMFLTNIVSDYTKKVVRALNNKGEGIPVFRV